MTSIALTMVVRDEADTIGPCIETVKPLIDRYTIIDTGSKDGTPELIRDTLADVPGELLERPWVNHGHNRTELLEEAKDTADYLLLADADWRLHLDKPLPKLKSACYMGRVAGNLDYALPVLIRGDRKWSYKGVAHAHLHSPTPYDHQVLDGLVIEDAGVVTRDKIRRDLELLTAEHARDPLHARTVFYLAQTYKDLGMVQEAIHYYRMRANMNGWAEETFVAKHMLGCLLVEHVSFAEGAPVLIDAWRARPTRIESLRALAHAANHVADKAPYPDDLLFVRRAAYRSAA